MKTDEDVVADPKFHNTFVGVTAGVASSADLAGDVTVGVASSADIGGDVAVSVASSADLAEIIAVGVVSSADLAGDVTVGVASLATCGRPSIGVGRFVIAGSPTGSVGARRS